MPHIWALLRADLNRKLAEVVIWDVVKIILFFIAAQLAIRIVNKLIERLLSYRRMRIDKRRVNTLNSLFSNVVRYTVYFFLLVEILATFQINIGALLAGAGVVGLAVGFGAQSLIKDILTGLLILFEDQYGVGDVISVNGFMGTVTAIGVRLTRVQSWKGEIEVIPNGQITTVTNYSRTNSLAVVDVGVAYETNVDDAIRVIEQVMQKLKHDSVDIIGDVNVLGVQGLNESDVAIRATAECVSMTHFGVQRLAMRRIKDAFDEHGIVIPFPQRTLWLQKDS